jgi:hypothetical protein
VIPGKLRFGRESATLPFPGDDAAAECVEHAVGQIAPAGARPWSRRVLAIPHVTPSPPDRAPGWRQ